MRGRQGSVSAWIHRVLISSLAAMLALGVLATSASAQVPPAQRKSVIEAQEVDTVWTVEFGVPHPSGLAYIPTRDEFLVTGDPSGESTPGLLLGPDENVVSTVALPSLDDFSTLVHDPTSNQITLIADDSLVDVTIDASETLHSSVKRTGLETTGQAEGSHPESAAVDPATGDLLVLFTDSRNLVRVSGESSIPTKERDTDRTPGNSNRESLFIDRMVIVSSPVPVVMVTTTDSGSSESGGDAGALTFTRSGPTTSSLTL